MNITVNLLQLLIGISLAALVAWAAWKAGSLSTSGAAAAVITGSLIFGLGGLPWAVLLLTFFITSSALSRAFSRWKANLAEKFSKGSQRDWDQVMANGGFGSLLAIAYTFGGQPEWIWLAYAGAMAAVNADTWSTELGVLSRVEPRMITTGKPVERGTSGGISLMGTLAALGGSAMVGLMAILVAPESILLLYIGIITLAGVVGALFDSVLGASVQAIYWCPSCEKETERHPLHSCGNQTRQVRGWSWLNNDIVNFACSVMGALAAGGLWLLIS